MRKVFLIASFLCAFPLLASAQVGFPDKPLWLSNTKPVTGQEISISTILYNGTDATVGGMLTFFVDDAKLTSQDISLAAQSSNVFSAKWTAITGTHSFSAKFAASGGTASATQQQTSAVQVTVAEPPPPSVLQQNVEKAAAVAGQLASSSAPFVQKVAQAVFTQTEALRNAGIEYLEKKGKRVLGGEQKAYFKIKGIKVELYYTIVEEWGATLLAYSSEFGAGIGLRVVAKKKGFKLNQHGLWKGNRRVAGRTEEEIYRALGRSYKEPLER